MSFEYNGELTDSDFSKLSADLHKKGVSMTGGYKYGISLDESDYGFNTVTQTNYRHRVLINDDTILNVSYKSDAKAAFEGLNQYFDGNAEYTISMVQDKEETSTKEWIEPEGRYCNIRVAGIDGKLVDKAHNCLVYELEDGEEVIVETWIERVSYGNIRMTFKTIWSTKSIKRKEAIEATMIDLPLKDMGLITKTVEGRLKLKKYPVKVDNVEINCHFDAKTESRSECTPDIINKVREARKLS
jgi:hypothetical protein